MSELSLIDMTKETILSEARNIQTLHDLLVLLNKIKLDELGTNGHPFTMPQLNYFINPKRNKNNYKTFNIPKKSGGIRHIYAPNRILKSLLTYTNKLLQAFYDEPSFVTGFIPGKSITDNARIHTKRNYVFNIDIKDFFPSISQARIWGCLNTKPFLFPQIISNAIAGLCCTEVLVNGQNKYALPQGSPCSPILSNFVCHNLDRRLYKLSKQHNVHYSRYADDLTFSSNYNAFQAKGKFIEMVKKIISQEHFSINSAKTRLQKRKERQEVTGLVVNEKVNVTRELLKDLDNILYIWERYGEKRAFINYLKHHNLKANKVSTIINLPKSIEGKIAFIKMVKGDCKLTQSLQNRFKQILSFSENNPFILPVKEFQSITKSQVKYHLENGIIIPYILYPNGKESNAFISKNQARSMYGLLNKNLLREDYFFKHSSILIPKDKPEPCILVSKYLNKQTSDDNTTLKIRWVFKALRSSISRLVTCFNDKICLSSIRSIYYHLNHFRTTNIVSYSFNENKNLINITVKNNNTITKLGSYSKNDVNRAIIDFVSYLSNINVDLKYGSTKNEKIAFTEALIISKNIYIEILISYYRSLRNEQNEIKLNDLRHSLEILPVNKLLKVKEIKNFKYAKRTANNIKLSQLTMENKSLSNKIISLESDNKNLKNIIYNKDSEIKRLSNNKWYHLLFGKK